MLVVVGALAGRKGREPSRAAVQAAALAGLVASIAFVGSGPASVHPLRWALAPLLALHAGVAAFWSGSLIPRVLAVRAESPADAARILQRLSRRATWPVPALAAPVAAIHAILAQGDRGAETVPQRSMLLEVAIIMLPLTAAIAPSMFVGPDD